MLDVWKGGSSVASYPFQNLKVNSLNPARREGENCAILDLSRGVFELRNLNYVYPVINPNWAFNGLHLFIWKNTITLQQDGIENRLCMYLVDEDTFVFYV